MVMRFEEGENFAALLERRRTVPEPELMRVLLPVLDGLELMHNAGFIHRDIKPDNIHIRADGSPVLLDFGSARAALGQGRTVTILVAPGYAPFEQYYSSGENQGPWTDLYGLGATCYRAIAGIPPLDAITRSKGVLGSSREVLVPARTIGSGRYSETVLRAIDRALEFAEKDRPQSIAEWRRELRQESAPARSSAAPVDVPAARASSTSTAPAPAVAPAGLARRFAVLAGFAGVAAVAGAIGAYVMQQQRPERVDPKPKPQPIPIVADDPVAKQKLEMAKVAAEKLAAEKRAAEKLAAEKAESERVAAAKAESEQLAATKAQAEREAAEKAAKQKTIAERQAKEKERIAASKPEPSRPTQGSIKPVSEIVAAAVPEKAAGLTAPPGDGPAFTYHLGYAHRGNGEAMLKVAESYESGRGIAQSNVWACSWYELAGRRGVPEAKARKEALVGKLQPRELKQCQDWADGQSAPSG